MNFSFWPFLWFGLLGRLLESAVSNTELSEFFDPHRVPGRELSEFLSAYLALLFVYQSELTEFSAELTEFAVKLSEAQCPSPKQHLRPFPK